MGIYLIAIGLSRVTPFDPWLEVPMAYGGLLVYGLRFIPARRQVGKLTIRSLVRGALHPLTAVFLAVVVLGWVAAFADDAPYGPCPQHATSCVKINNYVASNGGYYRQFPYDRNGGNYDAAPRQPISRGTYIDEEGTRVRQAAAFGLFCLLSTWLMSCALEVNRYRGIDQPRG